MNMAFRGLGYAQYEWRTFQRYPCTCWQFVANLIKILPPTTEISSHAKLMSKEGRTHNGRGGINTADQILM